MRKRLMNIPRWRIAVVFSAVISISVAYLVTHDLGGTESVLKVLMMSAPGIVCVVGIYLFMRSKLLKALKTQRHEDQL